MNRLFFLFLIFTCQICIAQRDFFSLYKFVQTSESVYSSASTVDTLGTNLLDDSLEVYRAVSGGFVAGNNGFGDLAKAQVFKNDSAYGIVGLLFLFGEKYWSGDVSSSVMGRIYSCDGNGRTTSGNFTPGAPGTIIAQKPLSLANIQTGGFSLLQFDWPVLVDTDFAAGIDFELLNSTDTVGLVTGFNGQADSTELAWELLNTGSWTTLLRSWPLDADLAIFPVIDYYFTSSDSPSIKDSQPLVFPNPLNASDFLAINDKFSLEKIWVTDASGKLVFSANIINRRTIPLDLSPGAYNIYCLSGNLVFTEKLIVK